MTELHENAIRAGESSGSFETIEVALDAPDAFDRIRAFLDPSYTSDDEIRAAIAERRALNIAEPMRITRWFALPFAAFRRVPKIGEPTHAPSVAQLMEDLNSALGNEPLGAEPRSPQEVWERLLDQVRRLAEPLKRA